LIQDTSAIFHTQCISDCSDILLQLSFNAAKDKAESAPRGTSGMPFYQEETIGRATKLLSGTNRLVLIIFF
jgi:hypothetical protein